MLTAQGIVGETYNRMLAGAAMDDPDSKYYLPNDYLFHGVGAVEDYMVDSYFAESKLNLFGKVCSLAVRNGMLGLCLLVFHPSSKPCRLRSTGPSLHPRLLAPVPLTPASTNSSSLPVLGCTCCMARCLLHAAY